MLGKKVIGNVYWHYSLTADQRLEIQQTVAEAELLSRLNAGTDYNVIKYDGNSRILSLLDYTDFFEEP